MSFACFANISLSYHFRQLSLQTHGQRAFSGFRRIGSGIAGMLVTDNQAYKPYRNLIKIFKRIKTVSAQIITLLWQYYKARKAACGCPSYLFFRYFLPVHTCQKLFIAFGAAHTFQQLVHRFFRFHIVYIQAQYIHPLQYFPFQQQVFAAGA